MFRNPLVSVIVPNYNHASFLKERIDSILSQTYTIFEILILDDKSTDNSKAVIDEYKDNPHVSHVIFNQQNSGSTFIQWRKGFELAKGDLIWIAESDDSCSCDLLKKLVSQFENNPKLVLAFCSSMVIDEYGNKKKNIHNWGLSNFMMNGRTFIAKHLSYDNYIYNASSVLFKKDIALAIDRKYENFRASGDWLFWIEICERGDVYCAVEAMNYFRKHSANVTEKYESNGVQQIENYKIFNYLKTKKLIPLGSAFKLKLDHIYFYKFDVAFKNCKIKKEVLDVWKDNFVIDIYMCFRRFFHLLKNQFSNIFEL